MEKSRRICEDYEKGELLNAMRHEECCTARARKMSIQKNKVTSRKGEQNKKQSQDRPSSRPVVPVPLEHQWFRRRARAKGVASRQDAGDFEFQRQKRCSGVSPARLVDVCRDPPVTQTRVALSFVLQDGQFRAHLFSERQRQSAMRRRRRDGRRRRPVSLHSQSAHVSRSVVVRHASFALLFASNEAHARGVSHAVRSRHGDAWCDERGDAHPRAPVLFDFCKKTRREGWNFTLVRAT